MAKKLKVGDIVRGYRITKVFGPGMMAISYGATAPTGQKVFFKQYKSPAPSVVWYDEFVAYQKELSHRVRAGRAAHFAVRQLDAFEAVWGGPCYFQAYEFVENGADLQHVMDAEREQHRLTKSPPAKAPAIWARHVTWARVLVAAVAALHESRVVHADLKPANAYLLEDSTLGSGYQLKLIDMDFSLLADRRPPWLGHQGHVGTDNYRSPEHITRGAVPGMASDVFTCGLMLYELLAGEHPYWREDQADYAALARAHAAKPPALIGTLPAPSSNAAVSAALHQCLSPDPARRPTAAQLQGVLSGRGATGATQPSVSAARAPPPVAAASAREPIVSERIELLGPNGHALRIGVRTELGKALVRQFGADGEFWDNQQCVLERQAGRQWIVRPLQGAVNDTLVNGETLTAPRALRQGDLIAVGRQAKGILKLPLTARAC
jgi:serine/threonine protein kinase